MPVILPVLVFFLLWTLYCVSAQAVACDPAIGSSPGGDRQGDREAPEGRFPYACSLKEIGSRFHRCGGTLIDPNWVVTAAHCVTGDDSLGPTPIVYVGAHGINDESSAEVIWAEEAIIHEMYTGNVDDGFDIALLRLRKPSTRQPAALAQTQQRLGGGQLLATAGWGTTSKGGPHPEVLQFADEVGYVINKNCREGWPNLKETMLCTFSRFQAVCDGDSGGPLVIPDTNGGNNITAGNPEFDLLVGIVSFGPVECNSTKSDVYTRVSSLRKWIDEKMGKSRAKVTTVGKCRKDCEKLTDDLFVAAGSGESNKVQELISKGVNVSSTHQELQFTPLHVAASEGFVDIVEMLINAGANVDGQNDQGVTPLYFAAQKGQLDVVKALLEAGASVDSRRDTGATPLIVAAERNNSEVAEFLLESGADVNAKDAAEETPLHKAAYAGNPKLTQLFLDNGAEIDAENELGFTSVVSAAFYGSAEVVEVLKKAGADLSIKDKNGNRIEAVICMCSRAASGLPCREGMCAAPGDKEDIEEILKKD